MAQIHTDLIPAGPNSSTILTVTSQPGLLEPLQFFKFLGSQEFRNNGRVKHHHHCQRHCCTMLPLHIQFVFYFNVVPNFCPQVIIVRGILSGISFISQILHTLLTNSTYINYLYLSLVLRHALSQAGLHLILPV